eukprot:643271-Prorocentrum_minimum.AAC.1
MFIIIIPSGRSPVDVSPNGQAVFPHRSIRLQRRPPVLPPRQPADDDLVVKGTHLRARGRVETLISPKP